jgi:hypothetical protein
MNWKSKAQSLLNSASTSLKQATSIAKKVVRRFNMEAKEVSNCFSFD